jgi:hypothetical protein
MKNTHLEHLEDNILNGGSQGGREAIAFLKSLGQMLEQGAADARVTVKWDGAPAVVCGIDPENGDFFVGTKSVFNSVTPKICYSEDDVDTLYGPGQLNKKLKASYRYLSKLPIRGVIQGDLLFTDDKYETMIGGDMCVAFQPNTIVYAVPKKSPIGQQIISARLGIVFHTRYSGRQLSTMTAEFGGINIPSDNDVFVTSSEFSDASGEANMTATEKAKYIALVNRAEGSLRQSSKFLDLMKGDDGRFSLNNMFKTFFNAYVREGKKAVGVRNTVIDFANYFSSSMDKEISTKKTKKTQDKYKQIKDTGLRFISSNQNSLYMTIASYYNLQAAKQFMIGKLQKVNTLGTFLKTENGYRVTAPEGFVAIRAGKALKLVDRLEFSRANFTATKNWDKG